MPRTLKPEYRLALPADVQVRRTGACVGLKLRSPAPGEAAALGALLLDAYRGTVDDEGKDMDDAIEAVKGYFSGTHGRPLPEASVAAWRGPEPVALCAAAWLELRGCPFVAFVATASAAKRQGVGRLVLGESLRRAGRAGHAEVRAFITEGNTASERLFASLGFERLEAAAH